ncbi:hypothetical protein NADFUDRAFT_81881 [Nadsonia fulvescens var. elongata DSM 6958]|uniref:Uncharacterized protein n=1 Tax=Nadsonia fulvescens var. elongata DSM 6958 TaxID=857566 RepID=A0A1E3PQ07_9ASCO|nr:hypothetical protein NADFUDRAFT_81881 [Nadsonia fulvescens var. elongata DSM 6958]
MLIVIKINNCQNLPHFVATLSLRVITIPGDQATAKLAAKQTLTLMLVKAVRRRIGVTHRS